MGSGMTLNGREIFESEWVGAADLQGKDAPVTIEEIKKGDVFNPKTNKTTSKLCIRFTELKKGFICNKTNATSIAKMHGKEASKWVGKRITLYPTTCKVGRETEPCLRVRETEPVQSNKAPVNDLSGDFKAMKDRWKSRREDRGMDVGELAFRSWVHEATEGLIAVTDALSLQKHTKETIEKCQQVIRDTMPE